MKSIIKLRLNELRNILRRKRNDVRKIRVVLTTTQRAHRVRNRVKSIKTVFRVRNGNIQCLSTCYDYGYDYVVCSKICSN